MKPLLVPDSEEDILLILTKPAEFLLVLDKEAESPGMFGKDTCILLCSLGFVSCF
jgi:hypothetical protein